MKRVCSTIVLASFLLPVRAFALDPFLDWTEDYLNTVRSLTQGRAGPGPTSRSAAMMYLAMYDAVNSITRTHTPYLVAIPASSSASVEAAAICAAHDVLMDVYPQRASYYNTAMNEDLAQIADGPEKTEGMSVGAAVAAAMLAARSDDGSGTVVNYVPEDGPGHWRPTWPEYRPAHAPQWGQVLPFGMTAGNQFPCPAPPALDSEEYYESWDQVRRLGEIDANHESTLEWEIAFFWANDQDGTFKPPGHMFELTRVIAVQQGLSMEENARLFSLMAISIADASIGCWNSKYDTDLDFWRPVSGIREADTDGNDLTIADPDWEPLSHMTPNFPSYTSGHSTFAGANAQLLRRFFNTDEMTFTVATDDPHLPYGSTRTMHSFTQAESENAISRVYLGVHWDFDCTEGVTLGRHIGDWTFDHYLLPVDGLTSDVASNEAVQLIGVAPNPTTASSSLQFHLATSGRLSVQIVDVAGRQVRSFDLQASSPGPQTLHWDGLTRDARPAGPGVYFVRGSLNGQPLVSQQGTGSIVVVR